MTLAVIDIDKFKAFNDTWGHQTGDQVIRFVAGTIKQFTMPHWLSARYGGEEFSILLPNETAANAELALNELRREIATRKLRRRSSNDSLGPITVSAGIAQRHPNETSDAFIERADKALYVAKNTGRNKVVNCEDTVSHQVINLTEKIPSLPPRY